MTKTAISKPQVPELIEMLEAGVHFGHDRSKRNPKMEPYIFMQRNRIAIFDLEKTRDALIKALDFVQSIAKQPNKDILYVGTKRQARSIVRKFAEAAGMPYVTQRWLGGILTNFSTIQKSIEKLEQLKTEENDDKVQEALTKKEKSVRRKEAERLGNVLEGIKNMRALPAAIFVVGSHDEKLAVREANRIGIPVIGITDTNANPDLIDYPIPANDDAVRTLELLVGTITQTIIAARPALAEATHETKSAVPKKKVKQPVSKSDISKK